MSQLKKVIPERNKNKSLSGICRRLKRDRLLKRGYREMASLNLSLARRCFEADGDALSTGEEKLTECE